MRLRRAQPAVRLLSEASSEAALAMKDCSISLDELLDVWKPLWLMFSRAFFVCFSDTPEFDNQRGYLFTVRWIDDGKSAFRAKSETKRSLLFLFSGRAVSTMWSDLFCVPEAGVQQVLFCNVIEANPIRIFADALPAQFQLFPVVSARR